jgi:trk system potassium uptake protein TrkH
MVLLHTESHLPGRAVLFEVFSALGTVGLSQGATPQLTGLGKAVLVFLMYIGRIGPLTLLLLFRPEGGGRLRFPPADVMVG